MSDKPFARGALLVLGKALAGTHSDCVIPEVLADQAISASGIDTFRNDAFEELEALCAILDGVATASQPDFLRDTEEQPPSSMAHKIDALASKLVQMMAAEVAQSESARTKFGDRFGHFGPSYCIATFIEQTFDESDDPFSSVAAAIDNLLGSAQDPDALARRSLAIASRLSPTGVKAIGACIDRLAAEGMISATQRTKTFVKQCIGSADGVSDASLAELQTTVSFAFSAMQATKLKTPCIEELRNLMLRRCADLRRQLKKLAAQSWPESAKSISTGFFAQVEALGTILDKHDLWFLEFFDGMDHADVRSFDEAFKCARCANGGTAPISAAGLWALGDSMYPILDDRPSADPIFDLALLVNHQAEWTDEVEIGGAFDKTFELFERALRVCGFPHEAGMATAVHLFFAALKGPLCLLRPSKWRRRLRLGQPHTPGTSLLIDLAAEAAASRSHLLAMQIRSLAASLRADRTPITQGSARATDAAIEMRLSDRVGLHEWFAVPRQIRELVIEAEGMFIAIAPRLGERRKDFGSIAITYAKAIEGLVCPPLSHLDQAARSACRLAGVKLPGAGRAMTLGAAASLLRAADIPAVRAGLEALGIRFQDNLANDLQKFTELRNISAHNHLSASELVEVRESIPALIKQIVKSGLA